MTNGDFVSRVINGLDLLNKDDHISRRHILKIGQNKSKFYISQKMLDKSLFRETNLFKTVECFKLSPVDTLVCDGVTLNRCTTIMKSDHRLPNLVFNRLGSSIVSVTSLDGSKIFNPTTAKSYMNSKDRKYSSLLKREYFFLQDDYLIIPDSEIEAVTITYIPFSNSGLDGISSCDDPYNEGGNNCSSVWDGPFVVPDKLSEQVIRETIDEVSMFRKIQPDATPNLNRNEK